MRSASSRVWSTSSPTGYYPVDQPEAPRLVGVDDVAGQQELLGFPNADLPRLDQQLDTGTGHPKHRVGEVGVVGGHDEVTHARQHQTGGNAAPLHGGDGRLPEVWIRLQRS